MTTDSGGRAVVVAETIDAIRALTGREADGAVAIRKTNGALGIGALRE